MCKCNELKETLTDFLDVVDDRCGLDEEEYEHFWECVDFENLFQTLCRLGGTVYEYMAGIENEQVLQYRGMELFESNAIQIYTNANMYVEAENLAIKHSTEVWLLADLTLAVTSCYRVEVEDTGFTTSYRAYKGRDWPSNEEFDMDIFCACLKLASSCPMVMGEVPLFEG